MKYEKEIITEGKDHGLTYIVLWDLNLLYVKQFTVNSLLSSMYGEWDVLDIWICQLDEINCYTNPIFTLYQSFAYFHSLLQSQKNVFSL
jgi:hypothetical protein